MSHRPVKQVLRRVRIFRGKRRAFTLVELLVVVSIIALLIAILLPSLRSARDQAKRIKCMANLHSIGLALFTYAEDFKHNIPDYYAVGKYGFRIAPGKHLRTAFAGGTVGHSLYPESWGVQGVLEAGEMPEISPNGLARYNKPSRVVYLPADSDVWICPSNPGPKLMNTIWDGLGNSYYYRVRSPSDETGDYRKPYYSLDWLGRTAKAAVKQPLMWDNYLKYPGRPGFNGPFEEGYTVSPDNLRQPPHRARITKKGPGNFWIAFYADGHCQMNAYNKGPPPDDD